MPRLKPTPLARTLQRCCRRLGQRARTSGRTRALLLAGAALCGACGGPVQVAQVLPTENPAEATELLPAQVPAACRFDLGAQRRFQPATTSAFAESDIGSVTTRWTGEGSGDTLFAGFETRDRNGHEAGIAEYVCGSDGLLLRRVESQAGAVSFAPALVVLPNDEGSGSTSGVMGVRTEGINSVADWTHQWSARAAQPPATFAHLDASWVEVASELQIRGADSSHVWRTRTLWAVASQGYFFVAEMEQTIEDGGESTTRTERAETVVTDPSSPRP